MNEFEQGLFAILVISLLFLIFLGICNLIGLGVMRVLDRRTGRKKWYVTGRCV